MSNTSSGAPGAAITHTLLVVETKVLVRMPLADYLRGCGYRVIEAASAAEARAVLGAGTSIDLVLADAGAPGANSGFALANWVRRRHPGIKVLLSSSISDATAKAGELCSDLVARPYEHASVLRRIQTLLQQAGRPPASPQTRGERLA